MRLAADWSLDHPHTHAGGDLSCIVSTRVGDHDDLELAGPCSLEQGLQRLTNDG